MGSSEGRFAKHPGWQSARGPFRELWGLEFLQRTDDPCWPRIHPAFGLIARTLAAKCHEWAKTSHRR